MSNKIVDFFNAQKGKQAQGPSPAGNWLNGTVIGAEVGKVEASYLVRKEMTNPLGGLHGGMAALICDDLIGAAVYTLDNDYLYTSVNLNVDFLRAAQLDKTIRAVAEVMRPGRNIMNVECTIYNEQDKIIAHSKSNLVVTKVKIK